MTLFAVQTLAPETSQIKFVFVDAADATAAIMTVAQANVEQGQTEVGVIGAFSHDDIQRLAQEMGAAKQALDQNTSA